MRLIRPGAAVLLGSALLLVGCTASPDADEPPTGSSAVPHEPAAAQPSEPVPANPGVVSAGCEGLGASGLAPVPDDVEDRVHGYVVTDVRDAGARVHASGEAVLDAEGVPVAYVVAEGDTAVTISERFCIGYVAYLGWINSIRRDGVDQLYPGDTLNLNRFTIATVGDQRGSVLSNEPEVHIPPQK